MYLQSVVTEQQQRISSLEAELRGKQDEHSQALLKLAKAQVHGGCLVCLVG